MQSFYSWYGSPLHLILEDEVADGCNRTMQAFAKAQRDHKERTGTQWEPNQPLLIDADPVDMKAYDDVAQWINQLIEINGGGIAIPEEQMTSDDMFVKL